MLLAQNREIYERATLVVQRVPLYLCKIYAVIWPEGGADSQYSVFIGQSNVGPHA